MKDRTREFLICLAVGAAVAAGVFCLNLNRDYGVLRCLCDGFFVAAALLLGIGGLRAARNQGTFDVAGFGLRSVIGMALPVLHWEKETMEQYRERKAAERKSSVSLLLAGAVYLVLSLIALAVYELAAG